MKKIAIIIITSIMMLCVAPTWASNNNRIYKDVAKVMTEKMNEKLSLNENQADKIEGLNLKLIKKIAALKDSNIDRSIKFAVARSYHSEKKSELKEILTQEQFEMYELALERLKKIAKKRYQNW